MRWHLCDANGDQSNTVTFSLGLMILQVITSNEEEQERKTVGENVKDVPAVRIADLFS